MSVDKVLYSTHAKATGGRDGRVVAEDDRFDLELTAPKELGGPGGNGTNPEQLFAAGYSACFIGAMQVVAGREKIELPDGLNVTGEVGLGPMGDAFGIEATLHISLPGMDKATADDLVEKAHQVCPYSNATRGNVDVKLDVNV